MNIYLYAPSESIPPLGTKERELLDLLFSDGEAERKLLLEIDENFRVLLQRLGNGHYGYWLIHRFKKGGSRRHTHFILDNRHFQGREQDRIARAERRKELKITSLQQAKNETKRLGKASKELDEALDYWDSLAKEEGPNL
ncbi:TPA: hypothetical protein NGR01_000153 [Vibrio parahaemolyticus]|uniref:hypothetical protein n=1 Tax=Vibrio TaxID=662 RepID=UPI00111DFD79|nr:MULTISPECIES: hypothetical protein [Vibrio]MCA2497271.1 hypothetical protein [Vibrio alginolyticus]MDW2218122.1 hypothetical protein [Vibrio sp. 2175-1]MDW2308862.1 hypothetical protein [Vibrio sp. 1075]TPA63100.1 hypothetical protein DXJ81_06585 [Vibrio parahaemolyticus]HCE1297790.1 hypothetical protein [Vibrio parahaemolyticus]